MAKDRYPPRVGEKQLGADAHAVLTAENRADLVAAQGGCVSVEDRLPEQSSAALAGQEKGGVNE